METRCRLTSFQKGLLPNEIKHRPITILTSLSTIFETLIHCRTSHYLDDIFHEHVFAYRRNHGADTALLSLTE